MAEWFRQGPAKPCTAVRFRSPPPTPEREMEVEIERATGSTQLPLALWAEEFLSLARRLPPTTQETYLPDPDQVHLAEVRAYRLGRMPADEIENWLNDEIAAGVPATVGLDGDAGHRRRHRARTGRGSGSQGDGSDRQTTPAAHLTGRWSTDHRPCRTGQASEPGQTNGSTRSLSMRRFAASMIARAVSSA